MNKKERVCAVVVTVIPQKRNVYSRNEVECKCYDIKDITERALKVFNGGVL